MDKTRFAAVMALVDAVLDLPEDQRADKLASCDDGEMRAEAQRLLDADARADGFLEVPAAKRVLLGATFGPFRLVSLLGRGGMGEVWIAERQGTDFEQRVALKLLPMTDDDAAVARFRRERQILARLAHPRIAKLVDGGVTPEGRPWLAMELVEGDDLTAHAKKNALDVEQRLRLFAEVCDAVQFAHQNLVVHRDLKPSNVIVTSDGEPKLLDFGIAKLLESDERELTRTNERPMTLDYAAPEQVRGQTVTTATDVWALGVMLHELLTGVRPYRGEDRLEVERAILAATPTRPSSAIADPKARRRVRGDLDAIVLKALRADPKDRYPTAEALAADVRRHLDHAPVEARGGARSYLLRATIRRHRVAFAISSVVALSLVLGMASTLWQARRAREEARKAQQTQDFIISLLQAFDPDKAGGKAITQREILERGEARVAELGDEPDVQARLLVVFAETWYGMAEYERARGPAKRALAIQERIFGKESLEYAKTRLILGEIDYEEGDYVAAQTTYESLVPVFTKLEGDDGIELARTLTNVAGCERRFTRWADAERDRRHALKIYQKRLGENDSQTIDVEHDLDVLLSDEGKYAETLPLFERTCAAMARVEGESHPYTLRCRVNMTRNLIELGRFAEADAILVDVRAKQVAVHGDDFGDIALTNQFRALAIDGLGRHDEAIALFDDAIVRRSKTLGETSPEIAMMWVRKAAILRHAAHYEDSEAAARRAIELVTAKLGPDHAIAGRGHYELGATLLREGRSADGADELRRAIEILRKALGEDHVETARARAALPR
jgi:serine/threonine protein kinase